MTRGIAPSHEALAARVTVTATRFPCAVAGGRQYRVLLDGAPIGAARLSPITHAEAMDIARAVLYPPPLSAVRNEFVARPGPKPKGRAADVMELDEA